MAVQSLKVVASGERKAFLLAKRLGTGLAEHEIKEIRSYFKKLGREPTEIELQTIGQTWSEHCFHKVFKSPIQIGRSTINGLFRSYIAKATEEIDANWLVSTFQDNAGVLKFEETYSIAAKVETHNHPSTIDPYGGAATGVGGVIRDILGVWAQPIANTDVLFFGELTFPLSKLPSGLKHPRYLMNGVVAGIGDYGNNMGIPTVNGGINFDNSFAGYALVFCGCIGLLKNRNYVRSAKAGDVLVIAGARTGRDGIHGVNFASEKIGRRQDELRLAVQIPNPVMEERLKRAVLEIADRHLASAITDLGGGGLSSAVCEIAHNFGCGAEVDLASVPLSAQDLGNWEVWLSETQERMLLVVPEPTLAKVLSVFEREEIEASAFGKLTAGKSVNLHYRGEPLGKLDLDFLFNPPLPRLTAKLPAPKESSKDYSKALSQANVSNDLIGILKSPNVASKEAIVRTYDHEVQGCTVVKPFQYPNSGPNDAAVLKPVPNSERALVISCGFNPRYAMIDTYWMAGASIDEAIRNNVAAGGRRIALLDNFAWGDVSDPATLGSLCRTAEACYTFAKEFGTPFISGKDSLYNETPFGEIAPTLVITALGIVPEISRCVTADFKQSGNSIYIVGETKSELGGSEYFHLKNIQGGTVPRLDAKNASSLYRTINRVLDQAFVRSAHDISSGGLAVALAEMCFSRMLGANVGLPEIKANDQRALSSAEIMFSESNSRFLVEVQTGEEEKFEKMMKGYAFTRIGSVSTGRLTVHDSSKRKIIDLPISECYGAWKSTFS